MLRLVSPKIRSLRCITRIMRKMKRKRMMKDLVTMLSISFLTEETTKASIINHQLTC
jgi:hypothetical protein